ncbi:MAG: NAD+ synthase [Aigarchaeota archaeon]|nr:NAD+ synthase [Candidatus Calditenuaceae archaeon]
MANLVKLPIDQLKIDEEKVADYLCSRLRHYVLEYAGKRGGVLGLSGGIDSATTAYLAVRALGPENVFCYILPTSVTPRSDIVLAQNVIKELGLPRGNYELIDIEDIVNMFTDRVKIESNFIRGNVAARVRMTVLHAQAAKNNCLVIGTSDKSELTIGYFTKYGDAGVDVMPIADLYKTQVRQLARYLGVPEEIIVKPPSPALWAGQTAESELGIGYELLDSILYLRFDSWLSEEEVAARLGIGVEKVERVVKMVKQTQHKRLPPEIFRLSGRSHGSDWRYPREWR